MHIAIHGRPFRDEALESVKQIFNFLKNQHIGIFVSEPFFIYLKKRKVELGGLQYFTDLQTIPLPNFFLSLGGDGTFLESVVYVKDKNIPIMGINMGRLGFLATTSRDQVLSDLKYLLEGKYSIEDRSLIQLKTEHDIFEGINFALNEFSILKKDSSSMIVIHAYLDGEFLNSYWSDGLIVSTPTGSTAYSLSCGGPVVMPSCQNFVVTPISPHNLNVRPLIISDRCEMHFKIESRSKNVMVCLDSRYRSVPSHQTLYIRKCIFSTKVIKIEGQTFLSTLRSKLNWGLDARN